MNRQQQAASDVIDIREAAHYLRFSQRKVYDLVRKGDIPHKRIGRQYRFSHAALRAWLSGSSGGTGVARDAPAHDPTDEELLEQVRREQNEFRQRVLFCAVLTRALQRRGKEIVVVGGHAAEFYTQGAYVTGDIDLVCGARDVLEEILLFWGFQRHERGWAHREMDLFVEAPAGSLMPEEQKRVYEAEVPGAIGLAVHYYGIEDLTVDRLNAGVHWRSRDDLRCAKEFLRIHWERVDWDYLKKRCREEKTLGALESLEEQLRQERRTK